ncbi:tRNA (adenine37-N(6))-methyltransferase TrmN6 [Clostridiaceae bacterium JG1575]|nr:tRNA (adenine37-N(6))-methyltransferase TrmN6 [Clostridiaceae bacterium JG1575]
MKNQDPWRIPGETLEELGVKNLKILQKAKGFRFGTDAVFLAHFAKSQKMERAIDLCSGSGIVPLLLYAHGAYSSIKALELQPALADMADRSVRMNGLEECITVCQGDAKDPQVLAALGKAELVTCNPPYKPLGSGLLNPSLEISLARHEVALTLAQLMQAVRTVLVPGGRICLVHRPERILDVLLAMRQAGLEAKRLALVFDRPARPARLLLVEGRRGAKQGLRWDPPLFIHQADGSYDQILKEVYGDGRHG